MKNPPSIAGTLIITLGVTDTWTHKNNKLAPQTLKGYTDIGNIKQTKHSYPANS